MISSIFDENSNNKINILMTNIKEQISNLIFKKMIVFHLKKNYC
jgi:hypothetical protein